MILSDNLLKIGFLNENIEGLDKILKKKKISYREFAEKVGLSHVAIWKLTNGKKYNPSLEVIERLCKVLRCEVGELFSIKKR